MTLELKKIPEKEQYCSISLFKLKMHQAGRIPCKMPVKIEHFFNIVFRLLEGHEASVVGLAWSPGQGEYVVSGSCNGDIRVWDGKFGHSKQVSILYTS